MTDETAGEVFDGPLPSDNVADLVEYLVAALVDNPDAIAIDVGVAAAKIAEYGDEYMMLDESIASEEYGICFRKADAEMCKQVEDAYMKLVEDGTYLSLAEKYGLDTNALCLLSK